MKRIGFWLVALLAVALGLVVGGLNAEPAKLDLLWIQLEWPLGLLMLTAFVFGVLLASVLCYFVAILPLRLRQRSRTPQPRAPESTDRVPTPDE